MPYDPYDSDDLIVIEVPTDEEGAEDDIDPNSDDNSDEEIIKYAAALAAKRKRRALEQQGSEPETTERPQRRQPAATQAANKRCKGPQTKLQHQQQQEPKPAARKRGRPRKQIKDEPPTTSSHEHRLRGNVEKKPKLTVVVKEEDYTEITDADIKDIIESADEQDELEDAGHSYIEHDAAEAEDFIAEDVITQEEEEEENADETELIEEKVFTELPNKYLLYDELVATIIGFDGETPIVEFTSMSKEDLKKCEKQLPVECGICPSILHAAHMASHLKTHQIGESKRYTCIYCDNTHCNRNSAAAHSRRHLGIRPYACDICDNYFTTKNDLKLHYQRKHMEREFICDMCGKTYAQNTFLKRHIMSHHEGIRPHQCEYCPKAYHRKGNLKEHIDAVHMGNRKPLSCHFCGIEFRDSHKLARHRKEEHLNKSHFQCITCGVEFTDIQFFNAHKRSIQCKNNRMALKIEQESHEEEPCDEIITSN